MSAETWAVYAVVSTDPKYDNATYTIDEETDPGDFEGWFTVFIDFDDGHATAITTFDTEGLDGDDLLAEIDRRIADGGHPPRGAVLVEP